MTARPLQESKFKEALKYYEMIVQKHTDNILNVSAIVLANLCVSYIMTSQVRTGPFLANLRAHLKDLKRMILRSSAQKVDFSSYLLTSQVKHRFI